MGHCCRMRGIAAIAATLVLATASVAAAEVVGDGHIKALLQGHVHKAGPRIGPRTPVGVELGAKFKTLSGAPIPRLSRIGIGLSPQLQLDMSGLPVCRSNELRHASPRRVRKACGDAEVGHGYFVLRVDLPGEGAFAATEPLTAYNGLYKGRPAILVRGTRPQPLGTAPANYVMAFSIGRVSRGHGRSLSAPVPVSASLSPPAPDGHRYPSWISGLHLTLKRQYRVDGERHSFLSAHCPPRPGAKILSFPMAFGFDDGTEPSGSVTAAFICKRAESG